MSLPSTLRPALPGDADFLMRLEGGLGNHLRGCRELGPEATARLARLLVDGREAAWKAAWPDAHCLVVEDQGDAVGRLWVTETADDWQLLHLAVLPSHRRQGIATESLTQWLSAADRAGARVSTRVATSDMARWLIGHFEFRFSGGGAGAALLRRLPQSGVGRWVAETTVSLAA